MTKTENISNMEINKEEGYALISINPKIYPLDVVYSAVYVLLDKAYIVIDGDPAEEIIVEIRSKEKDGDVEEIGHELNNELVNYAVYKTQSEKNKAIRQTIIQRALLTNNFEADDISDDGEIGDYLDDPEGIAVPWEEKYGNDKDNKENGEK